MYQENGRKPDVHGSLTLDLCPENGQKSFTSAIKHMKTRGKYSFEQYI
jgi:hypothetical protein